jgi:FkbM family methyltransferase
VLIKNKLPFIIFLFSCCCLHGEGPFFSHDENPETIEKTWNEIKKNYKRYYVHYPNACFYIDDVPDSIKSILKNGYPWEGNIGLIIEEFSKEGTTVIDIGAHIGVHTITMSKKVGPAGKVIAFEPQKKIFLELYQNLKFNHCTNVTLIRKALGETTKIVHLTQVDLTNEGGTAVGEGGEIIEMIPLDSLNLTNISLIKIDVENYEFFTLLGARETILKNNPVIVFEVNGSNLEINPAKEKENFSRVMSLIESYGYLIYCIHNKDYIAFPINSEGFQNSRTIPLYPLTDNSQ